MFGVEITGFMNRNSLPEETGEKLQYSLSLSLDTGASDFNQLALQIASGLTHPVWEVTNNPSKPSQRRCL